MPPCSPASEPRGRRDRSRHRRGAEAIWPARVRPASAGAADRAAAGPHLSSRRPARARARSCDPRARAGAHAGAAGLDLRLAALMRERQSTARSSSRDLWRAGRRLMSGRCGAAGCGTAQAAFPGTCCGARPLRQAALAAHRDVVVAIGELGHHGAAGPGLRLVHQLLHSAVRVASFLALGLELLAIVQIRIWRDRQRPERSSRSCWRSRPARSRPRAARQPCTRPQAIGKRSRHAG